MIRYALTRLGLLVLGLAVASVLIFLSLRVLPGDVAQLIAGAEANMARLEAVLDAAEVDADPLDHVPSGLIDLAIEQRRMVTLLQNDPIMVRLLEQHARYGRLMQRLYRQLSGDDRHGDRRVPVAIVSAAIGGAVTSPLLDERDDDDLRRSLLALARRLLRPG